MARFVKYQFETSNPDAHRADHRDHEKAHHNSYIAALIRGQPN